jgi:hypothetical protein
VLPNLLGLAISLPLAACQLFAVPPCPSRSSLHTRRLRAQLMQPYTMPAKRKSEATVTKDSGSVDALPMTAEMADELREKLNTRQKRSKKKRRICKQPTIDYDTACQTPSAALFLRLPRELRDETYHWLWIDARRIQQRYKRKYYTVTYGEQDDVCCSDTSSQKVRICCRQLRLPNLTNARPIG